MHHQDDQVCSYCKSPATDYDALFHSWCQACQMRKWLINWGAQHQWLHQYFVQRNTKQQPAKDLWVAFVMQARDYEVAEAWLRIASLERSLSGSYLGTEQNHLTLPPPDQETSYGNISFRNEWEAQWATFLTYLQVEYTYLRGTEHAPSDLPASTAFWIRQLFHLPTRRTGEESLAETSAEQGAYFVVTGPIPTIREQERVEHARLFAIRTGQLVYLIEGRIGLPTHWDGSTISVLSPEGEYLRPFSWHECLSCGTIGVFHSLFPDYRFCQCAQAKYRSTTPRLVQAYVAARYAHFHDQLAGPDALPLLS